MIEELQSKYSKLQELKAKNKVKFQWQDAVLAIIEDLHLPNFVQTSPNKKPLNVRAILMRHGKENLPVLQRRFATVKEMGKSGEAAVLYYLGIVESENKKNE